MVLASPTGVEVLKGSWRGPLLRLVQRSYWPSNRNPSDIQPSQHEDPSHVVLLAPTHLCASSPSCLA